MLTFDRARPRTPDAVRALADALTRPRYEVLPLPGVADEVAAHAAGVKVTVTASVRDGTRATLDTTAALTARGVEVVPHLAARLVADEVELKEILDELVERGVREVFVVGGDADPPAGSFTRSLDVLVAMEQLGHGLAVGIAGYPEHHPKISDDMTVQAMWDKRHHASYVVSQVCFDPRAVERWVRRVRDRGVALPVHVGVPGPAPTRRLLRVSRRIGVGDSVRFLARQGTGMLRVVQPGRWRPDSLLAGLAPLLAAPDPLLAGVHVYTFNAVAEVERWRRETLARLLAEAWRR